MAADAVPTVAYPSPFLLDEALDADSTLDAVAVSTLEPSPAEIDPPRAMLEAGIPGPAPHGMLSEPLVSSVETLDEFDGGVMAELVEAGLFDPSWYASQNNDIAATGLSPAEHYLRYGAAEDRRPNPHFDPAWYRRTYADTGIARRPLLHYFRHGEANGYRPVPWFEPQWYGDRYLSAFRNVSPLGHYLQSRDTGRFDPNPWFDTQFYLRMNPDVAAAGRDPFEHFLTIGYREGRDPSPSFDLRFYQRRYLPGAPAGINPLVHYLESGREAGNATDAASDPFPASEGRRYSAAAPEFEEFDPGIGNGRTPLAKLVAFYLPQFHPFPENDEWWGRGFTEWTNISRGMPRFPGHYQPRVPRDFGFYDLRDHGVLRRQVEAARAAGLHGFCFYYYNFNGKRLLADPVERFLADRDLDWPFCIMWANENWTRRWDGSEAEILIRQDYLAEDAAGLIDDIARHFKDPRYIRIDGRPLFFIYRAGIIPEAERTIAHWRVLWRERHGEDPWVFIAQTFAEHDPRLFGCDGAVEFPPHKVTQRIGPINEEIAFFDHSFSGYVYRYESVAQEALDIPVPDFPLFKTVFPSWDNDARRQGRGVVMTGSTPEKYQAWLDGAISYARRHPVRGEALVFVNAWNEWAEGAYLEPDVHFGSAYLNATARTVFGRAAPVARHVVILVAPQPTREDPQTMVRWIGRQLQHRHGIEVQLLFVGKGQMRAGPSEYGTITVAADSAALTAETERFARQGAHSAILFGAGAGAALRPLKDLGVRVVAVLQEMPGSVHAQNQGEWAAAIASQADVVVAPYASVLTAFETAFGRISGKAIVRAQAPAFPPEVRRQARMALRRELGLNPVTELVAGAGPATMRNGIDLFAALARQVTSRRKGVAFAWLGTVPDAETRRWLGAGLADGELLFRPVADEGIRDAVAAADLLVLTAREDAEPVSAIEALVAGLPVVGFAGAGGFADIAAGNPEGRLVPFADVTAMADAVVELLDRPATPAAGGQLARERVRVRRAFTENTAALLRDAEPALPAISALVLSGPAKPDQLMARLGSVFDQTHPLLEALFIEDRSTAEQRNLVQAFAERVRRDLVSRPLPTATSRQVERWLLAVGLAEGDFVWLMPPAGGADPSLLSTLAAAMDRDGIGASVCRSRRDDKPAVAMPRSRSSRIIVDDAEGIGERLTREPSFGGDAGAILWRRSALLAALERLRDRGVAADTRSLLAAIADAGGRVAVIVAELSREVATPTVRPVAVLAAPAVETAHVREVRPPTRQTRKPPRSTAGKAPAKTLPKPAKVRSVAAANRPEAKKGGDVLLEPPVEGEVLVRPLLPNKDRQDP